MSTLNEMTIKQLIEAHNAIEGVEPIVAWKGRKDLLVEKVTEAIRKARGTQTIKSIADALLTAVDYVDDAGKPIGFTYEHVLAKVLEQFPDANTTVKCLRWYNTKLNSDPNVKMPVRPRKRTAKVEQAVDAKPSAADDDRLHVIDAKPTAVDDDHPTSDMKDEPETVADPLA